MGSPTLSVEIVCDMDSKEPSKDLGSSVPEKHQHNIFVGYNKCNSGQQMRFQKISLNAYTHLLLIF